jgi:hypothetical protein
MENKMPVQYATQIRCAIILTARRGVSLGQWQELIKSAASYLRNEIQGAEIVALATIANDNHAALHAPYRQLGQQIDGTIAITLNDAENQHDLLAVAPALRSLLGEGIEADGCTVNIGEALHAIRGYGAYAYCMLSVRDPSISPQQFISWWSDHHSELGVTGSSGSVMKGYAIQHRIEPLTAKMNAALHFPDHGDLFELVYMDDIDQWTQTVTPQVVALFCEDEKGYVAPWGARIAMQHVQYLFYT